MKWHWASEMFPWLTVALLVTLAGVALGTGWLSKNHWMRVGGVFLALVGISLCLLFLIFFRDPDRFSQAGVDQILSPADGRVMVVETLNENRVFQGPAQRIAIFMHVGNVHVQHMPSRGRLLWTRYQPGKFWPAFVSRAGFENEQRWYAFEQSPGRKFAVVQIAGLLARRIICWIRPEQSYERGTRLGMISFGSEVDVYLPVTAAIRVKPGDLVRAGETIIGEWK